VHYAKCTSFRWLIPSSSFTELLLPCRIFHLALLGCPFVYLFIYSLYFCAAPLWPYFLFCLLFYVICAQFAVHCFKERERRREMGNGKVTKVCLIRTWVNPLYQPFFAGRGEHFNPCCRGPFPPFSGHGLILRLFICLLLIFPASNESVLYIL